MAYQTAPFSIFKTIPLLQTLSDVIFTTQCYASAIYAVIESFECLSIHPSHAGIVSKRLNVGSRKQRHTIAQGL